jgi:hypothetical protein
MEGVDVWDNALLERFSRQILVAELDFAGSERLLRSRATVGGSGPGPEWLGRYLAGAGMTVDRASPDGRIWVNGEAWGQADDDGGGTVLALGGPRPVQWPQDPVRAVDLASQLAVLLMARIGAERSLSRLPWPPCEDDERLDSRSKRP